MTAFRWIAAALTGVAAVGGEADAQAVMRASEPTGAVFEGQIVDSISGEPIPGVLVRMDVGQQAFSDERGEFRFSGLPRGRRMFALLSADCRVTWGEIVVVEGIPRRERLRLPPPFGAAAADARREQEQRRRTGGRRIEADEIERMHVRTVTELVRRVAPSMVGSVNGDPGATAQFRSTRSRSFIGDAAPVVVIDGVRIPNAEGVLHDLQASEVEVLEILPGAAAGWEFGSSGASGVIKLTLKRGAPSGAPERRVSGGCVVPAFPGR